MVQYMTDTEQTTFIKGLFVGAIITLIVTMLIMIVLGLITHDPTSAGTYVCINETWLM